MHALVFARQMLIEIPISFIYTGFASRALAMESIFMCSFLRCSPQSLSLSGPRAATITESMFAFHVRAVGNRNVVAGVIFFDFAILNMQFVADMFMHKRKRQSTKCEREKKKKKKCEYEIRRRIYLDFCFICFICFACAVSDSAIEHESEPLNMHRNVRLCSPVSRFAKCTSARK